MPAKPNSAPCRSSPNTRHSLGIYLKLASLVLFCTMDAMVKALGSTYDAFQLMLFRSAIAMAPVAVIIWRSGGMKSVRPNRPWMQAARIVVAFGSTLGFFYVFPRMPLVDAYAISFAAPLFMVALSVPLLGEPVGWRRWTAVVVGFVGRADHARSLGHRVPCHVADRAGRHLLLRPVDRDAAAAAAATIPMSSPSSGCRWRPARPRWSAPCRPGSGPRPSTGYG